MKMIVMQIGLNVKRRTVLQKSISEVTTHQYFHHVVKTHQMILHFQIFMFQKVSNLRI